MPLYMHAHEACCRSQDGVLAAIALCAADSQKLEDLGAAELCRGAGVAQQLVDSGVMSPAAVEGVECLSRRCDWLQHNS